MDIVKFISIKKFVAHQGVNNLKELTCIQELVGKSSLPFLEWLEECSDGLELIIPTFGRTTNLNIKCRPSLEGALEILKESEKTLNFSTEDYVNEELEPILEKIEERTTKERLLFMKIDCEIPSTIYPPIFLLDYGVIMPYSLSLQALKSSEDRRYLGVDSLGNFGLLDYNKEESTITLDKFTF